MGYRDEGEAALQRNANLQQQVAEQSQQNQALQAQLVQANAEIVRLRGQPVRSPYDHRQPLPPAIRLILRVWLGAALVALVPLALAAYKSETLGMQVSMLIVPLWGSLFGAFLARRGTVGRIIAIGIVAGIGSMAALFVFFGTIWRML